VTVTATDPTAGTYAAVDGLETGDAEGPLGCGLDWVGAAEGFACDGVGRGAPQPARRMMTRATRPERGRTVGISDITGRCP